MMYVRRDDARKFRQDYLQLIDDALAPFSEPEAAAPQPSPGSPAIAASSLIAMRRIR
ncbi:MAG: hypothetical protein R2991_02300 [Thermoanaerobaculia bacterium]